MDILTIAYGVILGIFLTIGDRLAMDHRMQYHNAAGLVTWGLMTGLPLAVIGYLSWQIAVVGMIVGFGLSLLLLQARATRRQDPMAHRTPD